MALYAGQSVGLIRDVLPAADIAARLVSEATAVLHRPRGPLREPAKAAASRPTLVPSP